MWVPLVECGEHNSPGADFFVAQYLDRLFAADPQIDTLILGCTHYPLLLPKIRQHTPRGLNIITQGPLVAASLADYLRRHPEIESRCNRGGQTRYLTTEASRKFEEMASVFTRKKISAHQISLI